MRILALTLILATAGADAPTNADVRKLAKWAKLDMSWKHLALADGVEIGEGQRGMRDVFPYWAAKQGGVTYAVTPSNVAHFLKKKDGAVVADGFGAMELVRAFVPGFIIDWDKIGNDVVAEARKLQADGVDVTIEDYRPKSYAFGARKAGKHWVVSLVALEIVGQLRLVHLVARVDAAGAVTVERKAIVDGPALTWQTSYDGEPSESELAADRKERARVHEAMLRCAAIAASVPTVGRAWVCARALDRHTDVQRLFGKPTKEWGKTARMVEYALPDDSKVTFAGPAGKDEFEWVGRVETIVEGDTRATKMTSFRQR